MVSQWAPLPPLQPPHEGVGPPPAQLPLPGIAAPTRPSPSQASPSPSSSPWQQSQGTGVGQWQWRASCLPEWAPLPAPGEPQRAAACASALQEALCSAAPAAAAAAVRAAASAAAAEAPSASGRAEAREGEAAGGEAGVSGEQHAASCRRLSANSSRCSSAAPHQQPQRQPLPESGRPWQQPSCLAEGHARQWRGLLGWRVEAAKGHDALAARCESEPPGSAPRVSAVRASLGPEGLCREGPGNAGYRGPSAAAPPHLSLSLRKGMLRQQPAPAGRRQGRAGSGRPRSPGAAPPADEQPPVSSSAPRHQSWLGRRGRKRRREAGPGPVGCPSAPMGAGLGHPQQPCGTASGVAGGAGLPGGAAFASRGGAAGSPEAAAVERAAPREQDAAAASNRGGEEGPAGGAATGADASTAAQSSALAGVPGGFAARSSIYRGVTRHRWTGRYEAHLWDNSTAKQGSHKRGRQVYLGGYDDEESAARAYDLAALKYWGPEAAATNFPVSTYARELREMAGVSRFEYVAAIRRRSCGFSRGASKYRGVTRHHQHGRWEARIGRVMGNKYLYLGTFATQEAAAEAYDMAAVRYRGLNAVTNFDLSRYIAVDGGEGALGTAVPAHPMGAAAEELASPPAAPLPLPLPLPGCHPSFELLPAFAAGDAAAGDAGAVERMAGRSRAQQGQAEGEEGGRQGEREGAGGGDGEAAAAASGGGELRGLLHEPQYAHTPEAEGLEEDDEQNGSFEDAGGVEASEATGAIRMEHAVGQSKEQCGLKQITCPPLLPDFLSFRLRLEDGEDAAEAGEAAVCGLRAEIPGALGEDAACRPTAQDTTGGQAEPPANFAAEGGREGASCSGGQEGADGRCLPQEPWQQQQQATAACSPWWAGGVPAAWRSLPDASAPAARETHEEEACLGGRNTVPQFAVWEADGRGADAGTGEGVREELEGGLMEM